MRTRLIAAVLGLCMGGSAFATLKLSSDFVSDFDVSGIEGWTEYGNPAEPVAKYGEVFSDSDFALLPWSGGTAAFSCSEFADGTAADQWLITPGFEVTGDNMVLYYTVVTKGNTLNNKYSVMISEGGVEKTDFKVLVNNVVKGENSGEGYIARRQALKGYEGKTVRLAFVNTGNTSGLLGFADLGVADYYLEISDAGKYENLIVSDPAQPMGMRVSLSTPVKCQGFTAVLKAGDFESTYVSDKICNLTTMAVVDFTFSEPFSFIGKREMCVTVTPAYEDAPAAVLEGSVVVAEPAFPRTVLIEEMTSTHCTFCPRGTAFLDYFMHTFDGSDGEGKVIAVAIHNDMVQPDPMVITGNTYRTDLLRDFPEIDGLLPNAIYNRTGTCDPSEVPAAELVKEKSVARTKILCADYDLSPRGEVRLKFNAEISYTVVDAAIDASVIVVENNLSGPGGAWAQTNAFAKATPDQIINLYGEELLPYFAPFLGTTDPIVGYVYQDVARGVYPSFRGVALEGEFAEMTPREFTLAFNMPSTVVRPEETALILVLTSSSSGEVLGADIVRAADYNTDLTTSGINSVSGDFRVNPVADGIGITIDEPSAVTVCSPDGRVVYNGNLDCGTTLIKCDIKGLLLVSVANATGIRCHKILR